MTKIPSAALFACVLLAGIVVRLGFLGAADLSGDEATSWFAASAPLAGIADRIIEWEVKPPYYSMLLHAWMGLFGDGEISLRALSVCFWPPFAVFLFLAGRRVCPAWAWLPPLLCAFLPVAVAATVEVRHYSMLLAGETAFLWLALRADEERTRAARIWLAAGSFAAMAAQFSAVFFILPVVLALLVPHRRSLRHAAEIVWPQAAAGAVYLLLLVLLTPGLFRRLGQVEGGWWAASPSLVQIVSAPVRLVAPVVSWKSVLAPSFSNLLLVASTAFLAGSAFFGLAVSAHRRILLAASAGCLTLVAVYGVFRANLLFERYYVGCAAAMMLAVGGALERRPSTRTRVWAALAVASPVVLLALLPPLRSSASVRPAVEFVLRREPGPVEILSGGWDYLPVRYYSRKDSGRVSLPVSSGGVPELKTGRPTYYVRTAMWGVHRGPELSDLERAGPLTPLYDEKGTRVFRWSRE